jgi:hypothetical protein
MNRSLSCRKRIGLLMSPVLVAGLFSCAQAPASQLDSTFKSSGPAVVRVTVAQGTEIHVTLSNSISSATSKAGDALSGTTTSPVLAGGRIAIPQGSTITGRVTDVDPASKGLKISEKGGGMTLSFDKVTTTLGYSTAMDASLISVASSTGKTAGIIGGSAAGGALLGKLLGGSTKDAAIGAAVGGGIGTGIAAGTKGKEMVIPAGTHLVITLDRPLTIADRS